MKASMFIDDSGRVIHFDVQERLRMEHDDARRTELKYRPKYTAEKMVALEYARRAGAIQ